MPFFFFPSERAFRRFKMALEASAKTQAGRHGININSELEQALFKLATAEPMRAAGGNVIYTPRQLEPVLRSLVMFEPDLAAYMLVRALPIVIQYSFLRHRHAATLQGDLMMALEKSRAVLPDRLEAGVQILARALCLLPNLRRARRTYSGLGEPYTEDPLDDRALDKLRTEKFVTPDIVRDAEAGMQRLVRDSSIQRMIRDELHRMDTHIARVITRS